MRTAFTPPTVLTATGGFELRLDGASLLPGTRAPSWHARRTGLIRFRQCLPGATHGRGNPASLRRLRPAIGAPHRLERSKVTAGKFHASSWE